MSELKTSTGSLFRRLLKKMRKHRADLQSRKWEIYDLERKLSDEKRRAADFERRLQAVVNASAERNHAPRDFIRLCVNVDRKTARDFPSAWQEAEHQLRDAICREMRG